MYFEACMFYMLLFLLLLSADFIALAIVSIGNNWSSSCILKILINKRCDRHTEFIMTLLMQLG